jgi:hypothetical protein
MDRATLAAWVDGYERAWRAPGVDAVDELFAESATYLTAPFQRPHEGIEAIRALWASGREPGEAFAMEPEIVAVDGEARVGVVQVHVRYTAPRDQVFADLWIVELGLDGRCVRFEEWPFWPPGTPGGYDPGPAS